MWVIAWFSKLQYKLQIRARYAPKHRTPNMSITVSDQYYKQNELSTGDSSTTCILPTSKIRRILGSNLTLWEGAKVEVDYKNRQSVCLHKRCWWVDEQWAQSPRSTDVRTQSGCKLSASWTRVLISCVLTVLYCTVYNKLVNTTKKLAVWDNQWLVGNYLQSVCYIV